jgi:uncharacterized membrane protein
LKELPAEVADDKRPLAMSLVNWGEVYYSGWRAHREKKDFARVGAALKILWV